ncbi:MAG: 16S rRNA (guanine(966)-N(2))-methyltransferase RsmD [Myxococcales bacterium]|nr:16S rRNA (guanine(966)-N(2))-methyltransferase RsmD [Myxococcales bacterium]
MRVIAGTRKGLRLQVPTGRNVRPTPDRVREALMSILGGFFDGERVLDLCAGSGAVGIELLSRGCGSAVFVEKDGKALTCLRGNLAKARLPQSDEAKVEVLASNALRALASLERRGVQFDYIYFDPPYDGDLYKPVLHQIAACGLLATSGQLWVESRAGLDTTTLPEGLVHVRSRQFGSTTLDCIEREASGE